MIRFIVAPLLLACAPTLLPSAAFAHSQLKTSVPAAGATVAPGPSELRLQFNEPVEARFCKVSVELKGGKVVTSSPPTSDATDKTTLIVKFAQPLPAGSYKINWLAVSADTHKVKGSFSFQVHP
jgi:copper resistance protein C